MIIEEVHVHNFGVYNGRHTLRLEPVSKKRPLVIIGALNGSGKTTLLDAMQLALYGKLGNYSSRGDGAYDDFLRRAINHAAGEHEGASVELVFRQAKDGVEQQYRAHRSWQVKDGRIREIFEVLRDGTADKMLSEHWYEYVEELLPSRIAPLFFFDGEKVVELADVQQAPALLRVAVQSLLGLDIVRQLRVDLGVLSRRKRAQIASDVDRLKLEADQRELEDLEARRDLAFQAQAAANGEVEQARVKLDDAKQKFRDGGGELYEQRAVLDGQLGALDAEKRACEGRLREVAAGILPLMLVRVQIEQIAKADQQEKESQSTLAVVSVLEERDRWIAKLAKKEGVSEDTLERIREALSGDRNRRKTAGGRDQLFRLSDEGRRGLDGASSSHLSDEASLANSQVKEIERIFIRIDDVERKIAAIPDPESVQHLTKAVAEAEARLSLALAKLDEARRQLGEVDSKIELLRRSLVRALETEVERHHQGSDADRIMTFASKASDSLQLFEGAVIRHHIRRLETFVLGSLKTLLRKDLLISKVEIDPETFVITLTGGDGRAFSMERLSAGERQLLAVSLLWGLAQASGRPMPTIIDTPLGRLDSKHRTNLVDRYFPKASHQVILLSTDMEIDAEYYRKLKPAISHSYTLTFDRSIGGTRVVDGFTFAEGGAA
jgi:DNA sulfur modification protein DndD